MRKLLRRGAVVIVPVVLLAACGTGTGSESLPVLTGVRAQRWVAASAARAESEGTARVRGDVAIEVAGQRRSIAMDGVVDFRTGALQFGIDMSQLGIPGAGDVQMEIRVVDGVSYLGFEDAPDEIREAFEARTNGRSWIRIDPAALGLPSGGSGFGDNSPGSTVGALRGVEDVVRLGTETVDGEPTTHYRGHIDVASAMGQLPEHLRSGLDTAGGLFARDWPVEVWVDADGRVAKLTMRVETQLMTIEQQFEFTDFGVEVELTAPPVYDVADFSQVFGGLGSGAAVPSV
jgi:hypothetical protein